MVCTGCVDSVCVSSFGEGLAVWVLLPRVDRGRRADRFVLVSSIRTSLTTHGTKESFTLGFLTKFTTCEYLYLHVTLRASPPRVHTVRTGRENSCEVHGPAPMCGYGAVDSHSHQQIHTTHVRVQLQHWSVLTG